MQRHDVALGQQRVNVGRPTGHASVVASVVQDVHAKASRASRHGLPDPTESDQTQRGAVNVASEVLVDPPAVPRARTHVGLGGRREPRRGEDEKEREIRGRLVEDAGGVAHRNAGGGCRADVDVVVADRHVGDDLQSWCARSDHVGVDPVGEQAHDRVDLGDGVAQLGRCERCVVRSGDDLVARRDEWVDSTVGEATGDEDAH